MIYTKKFAELNSSSVNIAGGKGASLGEMTQAGMMIPLGFVILSSAFEQFLDNAGIRDEIEAVLHTVNHEVTHTIDQASNKIRAIIESAHISAEIESEIQDSFLQLGAKFVAVRSSATSEDSADAAWAGQLETFLNSTEDQLFQHVKKCWSSLFTPRAIYYRFEKGLHKTPISVAVVIQTMVQSEKSGIAFSVHPVTQDYNQLIIEAGFGLGEAIVSGQVTPDSFVVAKDSKRIIETSVHTQNKELVRGIKGDIEWHELGKKGAEAVLSEQEVLELADLIINIEHHYGFPVDVEWAYEEGQFYITQSRPITTLQDVVVSTSKTLKDLVKIYSREKTLFYFSMWNDSDRIGYKDFLNHDVACNVFMIPKKGERGSVWYSKDDLDQIEKKTTKLVLHDTDFLDVVINRMDEKWAVIHPYLSNEKVIQDFQELEYYYIWLIHWWSGMNTLFIVPDITGVAEKDRKTILKYRAMSEKYTEKMNHIFTSFWEHYCPSYTDVMHVITPSEIFACTSPSDVQHIYHILVERLGGCIMINGEIFLSKERENVLTNLGYQLEKQEVSDTNTITGTVTYIVPGKLVGPARIVSNKKQLALVKEGDVLVAEMTNPDYVPAMKKALAVITDEGGLTCHAAIASRELKVPCIIGTKIATQILKDGDIVEVDADNGVVRILES